MNNNSKVAARVNGEGKTENEPKITSRVKEKKASRKKKTANSSIKGKISTRVNGEIRARVNGKVKKHNPIFPTL